MNFPLLLSLFVIAAAIATPLYSEMSATSSQKNIAPPVRAHDSLEDYRDSAVRQQLPSLPVIIFVLKYLELLKIATTWNCLTIPSEFQKCKNSLLANIQSILNLITCGAVTCRFANVTPSNFHTFDTHVKNILAATEIVMSNPSAQNIDALFDLMLDLIATNTNTSSINEQAAVLQKYFVFPISKVKPFVSAKSPTTTSQDNTELKADTDGPPIPYLPFPIHAIVPFSHIQWRMYPELLRPQRFFVIP